MNEAEYLMKNYGDLGGWYPSRPLAEADNTLRDLHNFSLDTQPLSLIVKYAFDLNYFINSRGKKIIAICAVGNGVKYDSLCYWSIVMTSPVELSTVEFRPKNV